MVSRSDILKYTEEMYHTKSEHLWASSPDHEVLRQKSNRKWYAVILDVPKYKVGLDDSLSDDTIYNLIDVSYEITK